MIVFIVLLVLVSPASCALVRPWEAVVIGIVGGVIVVNGIPLFDKLRIDDPVGALSVHGLGGFWVSGPLVPVVPNIFSLLFVPSQLRPGEDLGSGGHWCGRRHCLCARSCPFRQV